MPEASLNDGQVERIVRCLLKVTDAKVVTKDNLTFIGLIVASQDVEQGAFARAVLGDETHLLAFADAEAEVAKERLVPHTSCQILYL